ncbi:hypothetical protein [Desulfomicrobium norvegicum]|nr:hypothetical protein [Desulfomicrobium norvegicum]
MTANDFYKLIAERLPPDALTTWEDYRKGSITHFEALRRIFGRLRASPEALDAILNETCSQIQNSRQPWHGFGQQAGR